MKKYIDYPTETSTHLQFEIYYDLWWMSYFTWNVNRRWIYFLLRKVTLAWWFKEYSLFWEDKDFKFLLKELKRSSKKELNYFIDKCNKISDEDIIKLYERQIQLNEFTSYHLDNVKT